MIEFISAYTIQPLGAVLKMAMPIPKAITNQKTAPHYRLCNPVPDYKTSPKRELIIDALKQHNELSKKQLIEISGATSAVIQGLIIGGVLATADKQDIYAPPPPISNFAKVELNQQQSVASKTIVDSLGGFNPILLDGITGSGKTEVYFESMAQAFDNNQQVLILLPEIALSSQWIKRFKARFGVDCCVWHSEISPAKRQQIWQGILYGKINVIVGARSALHLPFNNLGLIIVDEEHDGAYKQEDTVLYNARDMAIYRAKLNNCPIVLASATPSLETWENSVSGRYKTIKLDARFGVANKPIINAIDMTVNKLPADSFISAELNEKIKQTLDNKLQSVLFLNRRGYSPLTLCRSCGHRFQCNSCQAWLVEHNNHYAQRNSLNCHHCGYNIPMPKNCTECGDDNLASCGPGVERIFKEVSKQYPQAKMFMATSETLNSRKSAMEFVEKMQAGEIDIVIGTQIIAKGYDFDKLSLVGIIDGDMTLAGGDLRAGERTFQILQQVAGRTGRGSTQGQAYIQTHNPNNPVIQALINEDRDAFLNLELSTRKALSQPPFNRLVGIIISDFDKTKVQQTAKALAQNAPHSESVKILGPAEPHMPYLRGRHRLRLLINADKNIKIQPIIKQWVLGTGNIPSSVRIQIDVDPYNFF